MCACAANVREEDIFDQLGGVVDAISVAKDIAEAITVGLNETHGRVKSLVSGADSERKARDEDHEDSV